MTRFGRLKVLLAQKLVHLGNKLTSLRVGWKGNPHHALEVANAYPRLGVISFMSLNQFDIFASK